MGQTTGVVKRVRELRVQHAWTQTQLAERAGVSQATVATAESGKPVSVVSISKLAAAFGVTPQELQEAVRGKRKGKGQA